MNAGPANPTAMKLKSYFSGTVEAAMELARKELGDEALLVNARPATAETRYLGAYEVVFGVASPPAGPPARTANRPAENRTGRAAPPLRDDRSIPSLPVNDRAGNDRSMHDGPMHDGPMHDGPMHDRLMHDRGGNEGLAQEVAVLHREFERVTRSLLDANRSTVQTGHSVQTGQPAVRSPLQSRLSAQDLDPALARALEQGQPFEDLFEVNTTLGSPGEGRSIVALVGPPGAGKTTTLAKLAAHYGLASRKPVQILSADVLRIGAADQLRSLASILGIGFSVAETAGALMQMLEEHRSKELVFIDTPGLSRAEMEDSAELATLIASDPDIDTHLVLPAFMRPADMNRIIHRYSIFQPKKLLFTHMDETSQYGALVSQAAAWSLPISFLSVGQRIPDDLETASHSRFEELILGASLTRSRAPASKAAVAEFPLSEKAKGAEA